MSFSMAGTNGDGDPSGDLLERILRELDEHRDQLEPTVDEYQQITEARAALAASLVSGSRPVDAPGRRKPQRRKTRLTRTMPPDDEQLEVIYEQVRRLPGIPPAQLAQLLGYSASERARLVIRPLSRLHRLGRVKRDGDGFRVAGSAGR